MIKITIKSIYGSILFEYEKENNTIRETVIQANFSGADLHGADLSGADLRRADLSGALNKETAYIPIYCRWSHSVKGDKIQIGCKQKTIEEWDLFFASDETFSTQRGTDEFKQIQAVFESYKAYLTFLNN